MLSALSARKVTPDDPSTPAAPWCSQSFRQWMRKWLWEHTICVWVWMEFSSCRAALHALHHPLPPHYTPPHPTSGPTSSHMITRCLNINLANSTIGHMGLLHVSEGQTSRKRPGSIFVNRWVTVNFWISAIKTIRDRIRLRFAETGCR